MFVGKRKPSRVAPDEATTELATLSSSASLSGIPPRYRLQRVLSTSRRKRVYHARDDLAGRDVAITAMGIAERDVAETEIQAHVLLGRHPNIVSILETMECNGQSVIVSDFYQGGDLARYLDRFPGRRPPLERALEIAVQVCRALEHAHGRGVVHGDLKPDNILLDESGVAVLGDFELASIGRRGATDEERRGLAGTPAYMAPETIAGGSLEPHSDLYALGCVLYEMATGTPPFYETDATDTAEIVRKHALVVPEAPAFRAPGIPVALNDLITKLLDKEPDARPANVRDVRAALEGILLNHLSLAGGGESKAHERHGTREEAGAISCRVDAPTEPPFVGRDAELEALLRALGSAESGHPRVSIVRGEPGIGKSRLLFELRREAEARGALVLWSESSCGAPIPYRTVADALLPIAGHLSELSPTDATWMRRLLQIDPASPPQEGRSDGDRERMFLAASRAILAASARRPLVVILDDLHTADSASVDLVRDLAARIARRSAPVDGRVLLVVAFRSVAQEHPLARVLSSIREGIDQETLDLAPLEDDAVYQALGAFGVGRPSLELVQTVRETTGGNPLFIRELLTYLDGRGALKNGACRAARMLAADVAIPSSIKTAIAMRAACLGHATREVVEAAAALGARFHLDSLAAVVDRPPTELGRILDEAVRIGLISHDTARGYRFSHPLSREVVYRSTPPERRELLHLIVARTLQRLHGAASDTAVIEVAHHLVRAGKQANATEVVALCTQAGKRAQASYAWQEAIDFMTAAIETGESSECSSRGERAELHRRIGYAYFNRFDVDSCLRHFDLAVDGFRQLNDRLGLARALADRTRTAVIFGRVGYGTLADIQPLEEALEQLPAAEQLLRAKILGTLAECHWGAMQSSRALELARQAMDLALSAEDDHLCAQISMRLAISHLQSLHLNDALDAWQTGLEHARRAGDLLCAEQCLQRIPLALYLMGRLDEAIATAGEAQAVNAVVGNSGDASWTMAVLAGVAVVRGDLDAAESRALEAVEISRRTHYPWSGSFALTTLACARALRGNWAGAQEAVRLTIEPGYLLDDPSTSEPAAHQHLMLIDAYSEGRLHLDAESRLATPPTEDMGFDIAITPMLCSHVEIARAAQRPDLLAGVPEALERARSHGLVFSIAWPHLLSRIQGVAAFLQRRWADAEQYFGEAARIGRSLGAGPESARTAIDYAEMLTVRNEPRDRCRARQILEEAADQIREYCHETERLRAEKLAAFLAA